MKRTVLILTVLLMLANPLNVMALCNKWIVYDVSNPNLTQGFSAYETLITKYRILPRQQVVVSFQMYGNSNAPYLETRLPLVPRRDGVFDFTGGMNGGEEATGTCWYYAGTLILYCAPHGETVRDNWNDAGMKGFTAVFQYGYVK